MGVAKPQVENTMETALSLSPFLRRQMKASSTYSCDWDMYPVRIELKPAQ